MAGDVDGGDADAWSWMVMDGHGWSSMVMDGHWSWMVISQQSHGRHDRGAPRRAPMPAPIRAPPAAAIPVTNKASMTTPGAISRLWKGETGTSAKTPKMTRSTYAREGGVCERDAPRASAYGTDRGDHRTDRCAGAAAGTSGQPGAGGHVRKMAHSCPKLCAVRAAKLCSARGCVLACRPFRHRSWYGE